MKKLLLISLFFAVIFTFISCEKEKDVIRPFVPISGEFTNIPIVEAGFWEVTLPDGSIFLAPKQYAVDGTADLIGDVDETRSVLQIVSAVGDPVILGLRGEVLISLFDADGDEIKYVGEFMTFQDLSNKSYYHMDGGTGKWKDCEGWFHATAQLDPITGVNTVTGYGEVTEPGSGS